MANEWEIQLKNIEEDIRYIRKEVEENRKEVVALKQEMSLGKGAIKAVAWIGVILTIIWTAMKIITYK